MSKHHDKHKHQKTAPEPGAPQLDPAATPPATGHAPHHAEKLSEAVITIAQPVLDATPDEREKEMVLVVATHVWNIALLPRAEQGKAIHEMVEALGLHEDAPEILDSFLHDIDAMLDLKRKFYAGDRRAILDYQVVREQGMINLRVLGLDEVDEAA